MDVAVTGAAGFIGSRMVEHLRAQGHSVLALTRDDCDLSTTVPDFAGCSVVYHFAADMGGVGYFSAHDWWPPIVNGRITANVMQACAEQGVKRAFFAASACAYPTEGQRRRGRAPLLSEDMLEHGQPDQMYGREKLMMLRLAERAPFDARVGILHTVYGDPVDRGPRTKFPTAIVRKVLAARETGVVPVWGDGSQLRSYLWIDDAVRKIERVMGDGYRGPVNIGYQGAVSVAQVVHLVCALVGVEPRIEYDTSAPAGVAGRDCDNAKFWNLYGDMEPTSYADGFGRLISAVEATA